MGLRFVALYILFCLKYVFMSVVLNKACSGILVRLYLLAIISLSIIKT